MTAHLNYRLKASLNPAEVRNTFVLVAKYFNIIFDDIKSNEGSKTRTMRLQK